MTIAFGLSASLADTLANIPAPDTDKIGRFFLDTATGALYRDNGTSWVRVVDIGSPPSIAAALINRPSPDPNKIGRFFMDTDTGNLYRDNGTAWVRVQDSEAAQPDTGPLVIEASDPHALEVISTAKFDQELSDPDDLIDGYEGLSGVSADNSDDGVLYIVVDYQPVFDPPPGYLTEWYIEIYSHSGLAEESKVGYSSPYLTASGQATIVPSNNSGLGGTLGLVIGTQATGEDAISAQWTIEDEEVFNVNSVTGVTTIKELETPSTAMVANLNAEFVGGKRAAEFAPTSGTVYPLDSYLSSSGSSRNDDFNDGPTIDGKWTLVGNAVDAADVNSSVPDHLYLRRNDTGPKFSVYYQSLPAFPCTLFAKTTFSRISANYGSGGGPAILPADPSDSSKIFYLGPVFDSSPRIRGLLYSNLSTYGNDLFTGETCFPQTVWLRIDILEGGTTVDIYWSANGHIWSQLASAAALGFTAANAGVAFNPGGQAADLITAIDSYRVSA